MHQPCAGGRSQRRGAASRARALLLAVVLLAAPAALSQDGGAPGLTREERAYLAAHGPIRYAPDPAFPPFESIDRDGRAIGITPDFLAAIGRNLGVRFATVRYPTWRDVLAAVRRGEVDMLGTVTRTAERESYLGFTRPYLSVPYVIFVKAPRPGWHGLADLAGHRLGVVESYGAQSWLEANHPELKPVLVPSTAAGLQMVATGQLDALLETLPVGVHVLRELSLINVTMLREHVYSTPQHLAVRRGEEVLLDILEKGLESVSPAERTQIFTRWTGYDLSQPGAAIPPWVYRVLLVLLVALAGVAG